MALNQIHQQRRHARPIAIAAYPRFRANCAVYAPAAFVTACAAAVDDGLAVHDGFSQWMFKSYRSQINEETERILQEKLKADFRKTQAGVVATAAGASFVIFMLFTLMLVLLAIERNTRPQPTAASEERPTQRTD
jgi:hypothetical protein